MARNKYPEVTVEKILDTAQRLFLERGYENTTIQDIVNELGGLTKGAVYHHFKSKEEIMNAVSDRMFFQNNPFDAVMKRTDLNGLQKMREMMRQNFSDKARMDINIQIMPLLENPRILVDSITSNQNVVSPLFQRLLEEGNQDGSLSTPYVKELAEVITLLSSLWLGPAVFPATAAELMQRFRFLAEMTAKMGVPLVDDALLSMAETYFQDMEAFQAKHQIKQQIPD